MPRPSIPFTFTNNTTADASQVDAVVQALLAVLGGTGAMGTYPGNLDQDSLAGGSNGMAAGSFSARKDGSPNIASGGAVVIFDTEDWDASGWYDNTTGRFTPQIAGYYRLTAYVPLSAFAAAGSAVTSIRKNGTIWRQLEQAINQGSITENMTMGVGSVLVQANGTTDYFDVWMNHSHSPDQSIATTAYFQGELVGKS